MGAGESGKEDEGEAGDQAALGGGRNGHQLLLTAGCWLLLRCSAYVASLLLLYYSTTLRSIPWRQASGITVRTRPAASAPLAPPGPAGPPGTVVLV